MTSRFLPYTGPLYNSVITWGELLTWAHRAHAPPQRPRAIEESATDVTLLEIREEVSLKFGILRAELLDLGILTVAARTQRQRSRPGLCAWSRSTNSSGAIAADQGNAVAGEKSKLRGRNVQE